MARLKSSGVYYMEIHVDFLSEYIQSEDFTHESIGFESIYLKIIDKSNLFDSLGNNILYYTIFHEIEEQYKINKSNHHERYKFEIFAKRFISHIVNNCKSKEIIKFLPIIIYIDEKNLLLNYLIEKKFIEPIENHINQVISEFRIDVSINASELNWESKSYENYKTGIKNFDLHKIYNFIEAVERGRDFHPNAMLNLYTYCLLKISPEVLATHLLYKKDTITLIELTDRFSIHEKLYIANKSSNPFLKIEALRQSTYMRNNNIQCFILYKEEENLVKNLIIDISKNNKTWKGFLDFFMEYPSRSPLTFNSLASANDFIGEEKSLEIIEHIKFSQHFNFDEKTSLNFFFFNIRSEKEEKIYSEIYKKWTLYVENFSEYTNKMIITSSVDVVSAYINKYVEKESSSETIQSIINELDEIDNNWYRSDTERTSLMYKYITKLFVFSEAANPEQKNKIRHLLSTTYEIKKERDDEPLNTMAMFKNNTSVFD